MTTPQEIIDDIVSYFADRAEVTAVYLYGSAAADRLTSESDVDVGVLYRREQRPTAARQLADQSALAARLNRDVDLVVLNDASPILRMQILKNGRLIVTNDQSTVYDFFVRTTNDYFDLKRVRQEIEKNLARVTIYD